MTSSKEPFSVQRQCSVVRRPVCLSAIIRLIFVFCAATCTELAAAVSPVQLLKNNNIPALETLLTGVQQRFEKGELTEIELRNAFRPFYDLDETAAKNLVRWASSSPKSYVAHLALGIYFKRRGGDARGGKYMVETPQDDIDRMSAFYKKAAEELSASLALTRKPYLSIFHLLTISMQFGDRATSLVMLRMANEVLPSNSLVRNRYAISLTPRWGGSYEQMDKFISKTKAERVPASVVLQLEAIEHDDKGYTLQERNQHAAAMRHFRSALELATRVGGTFAVEYLETSRYYGCSGNKASPSCR